MLQQFFKYENSIYELYMHMTQFVHKPYDRLKWLLTYINSLFCRKKSSKLNPRLFAPRPWNIAEPETTHFPLERLWRRSGYQPSKTTVFFCVFLFCFVLFFVCFCVFCFLFERVLPDFGNSLSHNGGLLESQHPNMVVFTAAEP